MPNDAQAFPRILPVATSSRALAAGTINPADASQRNVVLTFPAGVPAGRTITVRRVDASPSFYVRIVGKFDGVAGVDYVDGQNRRITWISEGNDSWTVLTDSVSGAAIGNIESTASLALENTITLDQRVTGLGTSKQSTSEKGQPNGYAGLDGGGKVPAAQLPAIATAASGITFNPTFTNPATNVQAAVANADTRASDAALAPNSTVQWHLHDPATPRYNTSHLQIASWATSKQRVLGPGVHHFLLDQAGTQFELDAPRGAGGTATMSSVNDLPTSDESRAVSSLRSSSLSEPKALRAGDVADSGTLVRPTRHFQQESHRLTLIVTQDDVGGRQISFGSGLLSADARYQQYAFYYERAATTIPQPSTAPGTTTVYEFVYHSWVTGWLLSSVTSGLRIAGKKMFPPAAIPKYVRATTGGDAGAPGSFVTMPASPATSTDVTVRQVMELALVPEKLRRNMYNAGLLVISSGSIPQPLVFGEAIDGNPGGWVFTNRSFTNAAQRTANLMGDKPLNRLIAAPGYVCSDVTDLGYTSLHEYGHAVDLIGWIDAPRTFSEPALTWPGGSSPAATQVYGSPRTMNRWKRIIALSAAASSWTGKGTYGGAEWWSLPGEYFANVFAGWIYKRFTTYSADADKILTASTPPDLQAELLVWLDSIYAEFTA